MRVFVTAKNFFVLTKYSGYDPEGSDNDNMGSTLAPFWYQVWTSTCILVLRTYTFGVNIVF